MSAKKGKVVEVNFKDLREAVTALNESGLIDDKKIKIVGTDKETILKNFMGAIEGIDDVDGKFPGPKKSLEFYNSVVKAEDEASQDKEKEKAKAEKAAAKPKKEKPAKEPKAPKEKQESRNGQTRPKAGTVCGDIWELLDKKPDITTEEYKKIVEKKGWNKTTANCQRYRYNKFNE